MKRVLVCDRFAQESFLYLQSQPDLEVIKLDNPHHLPLDLLPSCHGLLLRSRTKIHEELLKKARNLQVIVTATSGFDHIDLQSTQKWGITVMHTPAANVHSASQLTWALVLACCQRLLECQNLLKSGNWDRDKVVGVELAGRTYGVIGLGRIGKRVAELAKAFGMQVIAYDPYLNDSDFAGLGVQRVGYDEVLRMSHVLSFHVPKTQETENMFRRPQIEYLQRGCILVNTSRGSAIHEEDLLWALKEALISAAGLDVFQQEPLPLDSPLLHHPQIVLTPHIGANTEDAFYRASQMAAEKIIQFFRDGSTADTLPPRAAWYGAQR